MKKYFFIVFPVVLFLTFCVFVKDPQAWDKSKPLVIDHYAVGDYLDYNDDSNFLDYINQAKSLRIYYSHTSHGGHISNGIHQLPHGFPSTYLTTGPDLGDPGWASQTRTALGNTNSPNYDIVMWAWCHQVCTRYGTGADIQGLYLDAMDQLEKDYPSVTFIYMTGFQVPERADWTKDMGSYGICRGDLLRDGNNLIRDYIAKSDPAHPSHNTSVKDNKVLYDFADIESCNPEGNCIDKLSNDIEHCRWCYDYCTTTSSYSCPGSCSGCTYRSCDQCNHQYYINNYGCLNCQMKGMAFWTMMAEIAGWSEEVGPPPPACGDGNLDAGEECDPPGSTTHCSGGGVCQSDCTCPVTPPPECTTDSDCDDADPCTTDTCNVDTCEHTIKSCGTHASCNSSSGNCECVSSNYANCDGDWSNGCEVDLLNDIDNCGSCNNACGAYEFCQSGSCVSSCTAGDANDDTGVNIQDAFYVLDHYSEVATGCEDQNGDSMMNLLDYGTVVSFLSELPPEPPPVEDWQDITTEVSSIDLDSGSVSAPTTFYIGNRRSGASDYANGIIDEFEIYGPSGDVVWYSPLESEQATIGPDATIEGCDFVAAKFGNGARFDSPTENLSIPITSNDIYDYSKGEVEFWYQPFYDSTDFTNYILWSAYADAGNRCFGAKVYIESDQSYIYLACNQGGSWITASADSSRFSWVAGDWVHLRFVWDDSQTLQNQQRIYMDLSS